MIIPDQSHINRIRSALWQQPDGCASVMVGAGFCRNARKARPDSRDFPLWQDVAALLCTRLYPPADSDHLRRARAEATGTSGFLRLAQEYEAAFGRGALHSLIQELVPDDDYVPDAMHVRLLNLPWRDVFTTNWDTLLERTRPRVADRAYGVVRTLEEIPSARRPRIVKLHGSFPSHVPFIFSEEDYRTYPKRFAPFVNTVQQAMMETVFLLIGFSGDDPNFLHWSGWVRDNLGESAPKIYLAGWLGLSPHRRRMLEARNVVPIDLALHPKAHVWPEHLRHQYATDWILHTLEHGQPYAVLEWPVPPDSSRSLVPEWLRPVEDVTTNAPIKEPEPPSTGSAPANLSNQVRAASAIWKHNRQAYPGWLVIPPDKHPILERSMHGWEQTILLCLTQLPLLERLSTVREFVWRRAMLLEPLSQLLAEAVQALLDDIDCQARQIGGTEDWSLQWVDIREAWRELAMELLTAARQRADSVAFNRLLTALDPFEGDHVDVAQRMHHEKCLWALDSLDFDALEQSLKGWRPHDGDAIWMTRKAAILVELDRADDAVRLVNRSLSIVREAPRDGGHLASPSREGWTLWLALPFEHGFGHPTDEALGAPSAFGRWQQLAALQCDAFSQKQKLISALRANNGKQDAPPFDLGVRQGKTIRFYGCGNARQTAAQRAVRLCEVAGLPPSVSCLSGSRLVVGSDILELAADQLKSTNQVLASRLVLRLASSEDDATFNRIWARHRIAAMSMGEVSALVQIVENVIRYALAKGVLGGPRSEFWMGRLRVAMEALSRLALRLPGERALEIFVDALSYYRLEGIATHRWLKKALEHLLARTWEALPAPLRSGVALEVLSASIAGLDGFEVCDRSYPGPGGLLVSDADVSATSRTPTTEPRYAEIVRLIERGLKAGDEARKRAALRLVPLVLSGRLTDLEQGRLAEALWHDAYTDSGGLPTRTSLFDWVFLELPEPESSLAEQRFRQKWLCAQVPEDEKRLNEFFIQVGGVLAHVQHHPHPLMLSEGEKANLVVMVDRWSGIPVISQDLHWSAFDTSSAVSGLQFILPVIDLSPSLANALFDKGLALNQTDAPGFRLYGGLAKALPERLDEIAMSMRVGIASDRVAIAGEAVSGLHAWLTSTSDASSSVPEPPDDLLREIGAIIATRRKGPLIAALKIARWVFVECSSVQCDTIAQLTLHGLRYLIDELRYGREQEGDVDVPLLRWGCAHLALAMAASGYQSDPTILRWVDVVRDDPLPEVRHAEGPISVRSREGGLEV